MVTLNQAKREQPIRTEGNIAINPALITPSYTYYIGSKIVCLTI